MTFPTFARLVHSSSPFLPARIRAAIYLTKARIALQERRFDDCAALVQNGCDALDHSPDIERTDIRVHALIAALATIRAIANKRASGSTMQAGESFRAADSLFASVIESDPIGATLVVGDYLAMLAEFDAHSKIDAFSKRYLSVDETASTSGLLDCASTVIAPTPRMLLHFEGKALARHGMDGAMRSLKLSVALAIAQGDFVTASDAVNRMLDHQPDDGDAHRLRGFLRMDAGKLDGAEEDFAACVRTDPNNVEAHAALGYIHLQNESLQQAIAAAEAVLAQRPDHADALYLRGVAMRRGGDAALDSQNESEAERLWTEAENDLRRAIEQRPEAEFYRARAIAVYRLKKTQQALDDLDVAASMEAEDAEACAWRAEVLLALQRNSEALNAAKLGLLPLDGVEASEHIRSRLLTLKARSLMTTNWSDQAIDALWQAMPLDCCNEAPARLLLQIYQDKKNWQGLAEAAERLQKNTYTPALQIELRMNEINALRRLGKLKEALFAIERDPQPVNVTYELLWLKSRVFADVGDFEAAHDCLAHGQPDQPQIFDHVSMLGWVLQNLEPRDRKERRQLGILGCELYEKAMELKMAPGSDGTVPSPLKDETLVWVKKGIANSKLRSAADAKAIEAKEADDKYREIIADCEKLIQRSDNNALTFALLGWCQHCVGKPAVAADYYQTAIEKGQDSIPVLFDYSLVLAGWRHSAQSASAASTPAGHSVPPTPERAFASYQTTAVKARKDDAYKRIGFCRVAIRDLREMLFRKPDAADAGKIIQMLCLEIVDAISSTPYLSEAYADHIEQFLNTCIHDPVPLSKEEFDAISSQIRYARHIRGGNLRAAAGELENSARLYVGLGNAGWASSAWLEATRCYRKIGVYQEAYAAVTEALEAGIYQYESTAAFPLIRVVTQSAAAGEIGMDQYRSLLDSVFRRVGPARAYLDGKAIVKGMGPRERGLYPKTVVGLFPPVRYDGAWFYLDEQIDSTAIPNDDSVVAPFLNPLRPFIIASSSANYEVEV